MKKSNHGFKVAYPAVLGALSLIFIYAASIFPTGSWGIIALAGLFPAAAVISIGLKAGFLCWAGVSALAMLLLPGKFGAMLYAVLFGLYPMIKSLIERIRKRLPEVALKLAFFNVAFTLIYLVMRQAVLDSLPSMLGITWVLYVVGNIVFLLYDFGFTKLIGFYIARIGRAVR